MNQIAIGNTERQAMSSREIAELTGKEHRNVMADIRSMLAELHGESGVLSFQQSYINSQNKEQPEFLLPKREALILTSGYSVKQRAAIIDRWQELEATKSVALPSYTEALRQLADTLDLNQQQQQVIAHQAPKVDAFERIAGADGMVNLQTAGKVLQQPPNKFIQRLREIGWIFKRSGSRHNSAHVEKINAGYLAVKLTATSMPDGSERQHEQVMVTPKGITKLAMMLGGVH